MKKISSTSLSAAAAGIAVVAVGVQTAGCSWLALTCAGMNLGILAVLVARQLRVSSPT